MDRQSVHLKRRLEINRRAFLSFNEYFSSLHLPCFAADNFFQFSIVVYSPRRRFFSLKIKKFGWLIILDFSHPTRTTAAEFISFL